MFENHFVDIKTMRNRVLVQHEVTDSMIPKIDGNADLKDDDKVYFTEN